MDPVGAVLFVMAVLIGIFFASLYLPISRDGKRRSNRTQRP
jgi:type II secretory pathway component PulF